MKKAHWSFIIALIAVVLTTLVKVAFDPLFPMEAAPFSLYCGAVVIAGWYGGIGAGAIAAGLSIVVVLILHGGGTLSLGNIGGQLLVPRILFFLFESTVITLLAESLRVANVKAKTAERLAVLSKRQKVLTEQRFKDLVAAGPIGVCAGTLEGWIKEANDPVLKILGLSRERLDQGPISWREMTPPEYFEADSIAVNQIRNDGVCKPYDKEFIRPDGRRIPVLIAATRLEDVPDGFLAFIFDRSIESQTENQLLAAQEAYESARRVKLDFLANTSHELRTPMNAIIGMTQLALQENVSPVVRQYLETSHQAAQDLLSLISDILDFSKVSSGKFSLESQRFSLRTLLDRVMKSLSPRAAEKGIELALHVPASISDTYLGDPLRLRQILLNIGGNAVKFTEKGEVAVRVSSMTAADGKVTMIFSIADTGVGIPPEAVGKILEPFTQVDSSTTRRHAGVGLGLSIALDFARLMNGRIWCESQLGKGSTFYVQVDLQRASGEDPGLETQKELAELEGLHVLVVDDNKTNRTILVEMLENWKMRVDAVDNAESGLAMLRAQFDADDRYQLVLADALMPGMDGFDFIDRIRHGEKLIDPVVVMLSSADRQLFTERSEGLQISSFLEKPVSAGDLAHAILSAMGKSRKAPDAPMEWGAAARRTLRVLVAEDTRANQLVVQRSLEARGHEVRIAHNGREAIDAWKNGHFDIILMDVQMPIIDGLQATVAIRTMESNTSVEVPIPIVAMTAHAMQGDQQRCLDSGMDDFIPKPVDVKVMVNKIEALADRHRRQNQLRVATTNEWEKTVKRIDMDEALDRMGGDRGLLCATAEYFLEDGSALMESLTKAVDEGDMKRARLSAHSLKGLAANFSAAPVVELAETIERAAARDIAEEIPPLLPSLEEELDYLINQLREFVRSQA